MGCFFIKFSFNNIYNVSYLFQIPIKPLDIAYLLEVPVEFLNTSYNSVKNKNSQYEQFISKDTSSTFRGIAAVMIILSHYAEWYSWFVQTDGNMEIIRVAFTKLGVYGVDIFFLFSGYAMVRSLGNEKMNLDFLWKRIKNVYIPYFIIAGVIELVSGGFTSLHDFLLFAGGYDYWYMNVLFVFYIGFIIIYALIKNNHGRTAVFCVFAYIYSYTLYSRGMYEFWYVSNITFALGIVMAEYEKYVKKLTDKMGLPLTAALGIAMLFVIRYGLYGEAVISKFTAEQQIFLKIGATLVWALLVLMLAAKWNINEKIFAFLGKNSLYLYLTHTFVFMRCINSQLLSDTALFANIAPNKNIALMAIFTISAIITVVLSTISALIITNVIKTISHLLWPPPP